MKTENKKVWWVNFNSIGWYKFTPEDIENMKNNCSKCNKDPHCFFERCTNCKPEEFVYQEEHPFWKPNEFVRDINYWVYDSYEKDWEYWNGCFEPNVNPHVCPRCLESGENGPCGYSYCYACYPENFSFQGEEEKPCWIPGYPITEKEKNLKHLAGVDKSEPCGSIVTRSLGRYPTVKSEPPPLQFQGHLKGCHAAYWHNYDKCSCGIALARGFATEHEQGFVSPHDLELKIETPFVSDINLDWD